MARDFRDFGGMTADDQALFEQQFADIDRRRQDIDAAQQRQQAAYQTALGEVQGARDVSMQGARTSSLMPVYSMMGQSGLAGAYSGGQAQAASQASMQGATRASQLGATFADRLAQMATQQAEQERQFDTQRTDVETAKTQLEGQAMTKVDQSVQDDMTGLRDANYLDVEYMEALLRRAAALPPGRARDQYLTAARDIFQADTFARVRYGNNPQVRGMLGV
jgi:hypothetical protein